MSDGEAQEILSAVEALMEPTKFIMRKGLAMAIDVAPDYARCAKAYYDAYKGVGFSEEQALSLAKHAMERTTHATEQATRAMKGS